MNNLKKMQGVLKASALVLTMAAAGSAMAQSAQVKRGGE